MRRTNCAIFSWMVWLLAFAIPVADGRAQNPCATVVVGDNSGSRKGGFAEPLFPGLRTFVWKK